MVDKKKDGGYIEKTLKGDIASFDVDDTLDAASAASGLIPGKIGQLAAAPIEALHGSITSERDMAEIKKALGNTSVAARDSKNRALRRKLNELAGRSGQKLEEVGMMGVGAMAGGAVVGSVLPIPFVGHMAGMWLGAEGAQILYDEAIKTQDQDAVGLVIEMKEMQKRKQPIAAEYVFATLASNLPDKEAKKVEDRLFALTGKRKFAEAIQDGHTMAVTRLMHEFDLEVRVDTGLSYDAMENPLSPIKTASEEYAELINSGKMDARALLIREDMPSVMEITKLHMEKQKKPAISSKDVSNAKAELSNHDVVVGEQGIAAVPKQSTKRVAFKGNDLSSLAADLNARGITIAIGDDGQLTTIPLQQMNKPGKSYSKE
ncbi:MAG: hypothetical protein ACK502_09310 [Alphaproteobacteria bacterium]